jgi:hypothetical protein
VPLAGYFEVSAAPMAVAAPCAYECTNCASLISCSSCRAGFFLLANGSCNSSCPSRSYYNTSAGTCDPCPSNCTLCLAPVLCQACAHAYYLDPQGLCVIAAECSVGRYPDRITLVCEACLFDCQSCTNNTSCAFCNASNHRVLNLTSSRCDPVLGYFENGVALALQCPSLCTACLSLAQCTACQPQFYVGRNGSCLEDCAPQLVVPGQPRTVCQNCPYDCLTCNLYGDCLSCNTS